MDLFERRYAAVKMDTGLIKAIYGNYKSLTVATTYAEARAEEDAHSHQWGVMMYDGIGEWQSVVRIEKR